MGISTLRQSAHIIGIVLLVSTGSTSLVRTLGRKQLMARRWLTSSTTLPPVASAAGVDSGPPQAPHFQWDLHRPAVRIAILDNVLVVVLFFAAVVWRLFFAGKGQQEGVVDPEGASRGGAALATAVDVSSSGVASPCALTQATGMRKVDLMALPVYVHRASEAAKEGAGKVECAVCICELSDGDTGRLLPRCGHRFHAECVDRCFWSHATCPLCRAVVAGGGSGKANPRRSLE